MSAAMWTTDRPTAPGYYWCRDTDARAPLNRGAPFITEVLARGRRWWFVQPGDDHRTTSEIFPLLEWAGPLEPPA